MRRVIVVDGTFLKNKYRGVLLVATAVDGNSNLYPIAFGVVDSDNDDSWGWFFRQLKVVIADCQDLAFTKGLTALVEKVSRAYRSAEFQERITEIFEMSHELGRYLREADVRKWACSLFPGERYDIRTTNLAESINSVLRIPREYPVIPLLDSIRELLTRWFYERRLVSSKHLDPLTTKVEKKIDRRIVKAKSLSTPINHVFVGTGMEVHRFTDGLYTAAAWRTAYVDSINPIAVPECEWNVPGG
ncbi:uncharacterized protein LOC106442270 [Brassica napus]|uniref:uncharacterized protein LOC106442270 n=1 Tax=Brassica napus TaxID=3708 RepID=UPI0006AADE50|nr:uncharacterized protein LOC106442270 [Brassica napus]